MSSKDKPAPALSTGSDLDNAATSLPGKTLNQRDAQFTPDQLRNFLEPARGPGELGWIAHFRVLKLIGQGGMGMVFLAEDSQLRRQVALKIIRPDKSSEELRKRLIREAQACAAVEASDHIVTIYHAGSERGFSYFAMQYLRGLPLNHWLQKQGRRLALKDVLRIGREVASGLAVAHAHGLIHRDIKPANLWLESPSGRVKILDFGLARPVESDDDTEEITQVGQVVGTPGYLAPEQADGADLTGRTDIFGLGCVLYELATGQLPFPGKTPLARLKAMVAGNPKPAIELNAELPQAFSDLLRRMIEQDPALRPESAREVAAAIEQIEFDLKLATAGVRDSGFMTAVDDAALFGEITDDSVSTRSQIRPRPKGSATKWIFAGIGVLGLLAAGLIYMLTRDGLNKSTASNKESAEQKPDPKQPAGTSKKILDRPMDQRERAEMAKLPINAQQEELRKDLVRWNRGFMLNKHTISVDTLGSGAIKSVDLTCESLSDLTPLKSLPELRQVSITAANKPVNLKALADLPIDYLLCHNAEDDIADLGEAKRLTHLDLDGCIIANVEKIPVIYLRTLKLNKTGIKHFDWILSQPTIVNLEIRGLPVTSLDPLATMKKLEVLDFTDCPGVEQIDALKKLPLREVRCTYRPAYGKVFKEMPTLTTINGKSREEFFKE